MPKSFVIARATNLEIVRRPTFWSLILITIVFLWLSALLPYFTFGEDIKMVKDQGLAMIMVVGLAIAIYSASVSIAEEIEGKTAITLLSKPILRRDFIIGKFLGIMTAVGLMFLVLSFMFAFVLYYKIFYEANENKFDIPTRTEAILSTLDMVPAILLTYFQVTMLCALSVALSTRLPVYFNITTCILVFLLGHVAPQMVQASETLNMNEAVTFIARIFATVLPGLEYFNVGPAISGDIQVPWLQYVLPCFGYCVLYSTILLLFGLLMFEDRDLA